MDVELTAKDRAIRFAGATTAAPSSGSKGSSDSPGVTAGEVLGALAAGAIIAGAIAHYADSPPKPFEAGTLNARMLGKRVVRRSGGNADWYYDDGSRVNPVYQLQGKARSYILDAPTQRAITDPDVVAAQRSLQRALESFSWTRETEITADGRLFYTCYSGKNDAGKDFVAMVAVNIATLDFSRAKRIDPSDGLSQFEIPCKGDEPCAIRLDKDSAGHLSDNHISYDLTVFFIGDTSGQAVWNALLRLRDLYPEEPAVAAR